MVYRKRYSKKKMRGGRFRLPRVNLKKIGRWAGSVNKFLKDSKIISRLGSAYGASNMRGAQGVGLASTAGGQFGYGRRKTRRRRMGYGLYAAGRRGRGLRPA